MNHSPMFESEATTFQLFYWYIQEDFSSSSRDNTVLIPFCLARPSKCHWPSSVTPPHPPPPTLRKDTKRKSEQRRWGLEFHHSPQGQVPLHREQWGSHASLVWLLDRRDCWPCWHGLIIPSTGGAETEGSQVQAQPDQISKGWMQNEGNSWGCIPASQ